LIKSTYFRLYYGEITIPQAVASELNAANVPPVVKSWMENLPRWLQVEPDGVVQIDELTRLDPGERAAILLAERLNADLVILDDKAARQAAVERGLKVIGLLGILRDAARQDLIDLAATFSQLREVGFWVAPNLLEKLMAEE
jgi:predicted nucleic acid-binding protein